MTVVLARSIEGANVAAMRQVVAVIKPFKLNACLRALNEAGIEHVTHSEARGYGRQKDHLKDYGNDRFAVAFLPRVRVEFTVAPDKLRGVLDAFMQACRTGRQGDGKIWVLDARTPVMDAVKS
ncbi:MAG: P-II family nitrogen regulator [Planctomycetes bacterium]|nr:P-II family nitrogen regulator [Planctomycetota bacterium]